MILKELDRFSEGEPILESDFNVNSKSYLRQELKKFTDEGILIRVKNGVYYKAYKTILGTNGSMSINKYLNKVYLNDETNGFFTGLMIANKYGFTSQNSAVIEISSNKATTRQRKLNIDGYKIIIYKPVTKINQQNKSALTFLDLMAVIDKYCELDKDEYRNQLRKFVTETNVDFEMVKKYISLYPTIVYKNIYEGGLMNELL